MRTRLPGATAPARVRSQPHHEDDGTGDVPAVSPRPSILERQALFAQPRCLSPPLTSAFAVETAVVPGARGQPLGRDSCSSPSSLAAAAEAVVTFKSGSVGLVTGNCSGGRPAGTPPGTVLNWNRGLPALHREVLASPTHERPSREGTLACGRGGVGRQRLSPQRHHEPADAPDPR